MPDAMTSPVDHPVLGRMTYDPDLHWYQGQTESRGLPVALTLSCDEGPPAFDALAAVVADLDRLREDAEAQTVADLLALKNEEWLDEDDGEGAETAESFRAKLRLESVGLAPDGVVTFSFEDGDLFWGHAILVDRAADGTWDEADIAG